MNEKDPFLTNYKNRIAQEQKEKMLLAKKAATILNSERPFKDRLLGRNKITPTDLLRRQEYEERQESDFKKEREVRLQMLYKDPRFEGFLKRAKILEREKFLESREAEDDVFFEKVIASLYDDRVDDVEHTRRCVAYEEPRTEWLKFSADLTWLAAEYSISLRASQIFKGKI